MYRGERSEKFGRENEAVGEGRRKEKAIKERGQGRERQEKEEREGQRWREAEAGTLSQLLTCSLCNNRFPMNVGSSCAWHQRSAT